MTVTNPLFWLGLSLLLVALSLVALLAVAVSLLRELSRTCRSAERLCDILAQDLPPTLEAIRLTSLELTELTDDVNDGVHHAGAVIRQVDQGLTSARQQTRHVQTGTRSLWAGIKAAWRTWNRPPRRKRPRRLRSRRETVTNPRPPARKASGTAAETSQRSAVSPPPPSTSSSPPQLPNRQPSSSQPDQAD